MRTAWQLIGETVRAYAADNGPRLAAALSYYTIFSLAPLLIILLGFLGIFFGQAAARSELHTFLNEQAGEQIASFIEGLISSTAQGSNQTATIIGFGILIVASTNLFTAMQGALNTIWRVTEPRYGGFMQLLFMRLLSLLIMVALAAIALVALTAQTVMGWMADRLAEQFSGIGWLIKSGEQLLALAVITIAFIAVHKILVHRRVGWRAVLVGALLTAILFRVGEQLILLYLRMSTVSSAFGAAGSLVALLLFIYYSMQIFLLGASFTRVYDQRITEARAHEISNDAQTGNPET